MLDWRSVRKWVNVGERHIPKVLRSGARLPDMVNHASVLLHSAAHGFTRADLHFFGGILIAMHWCTVQKYIANKGFVLSESGNSIVQKGQFADEDELQLSPKTWAAKRWYQMTSIATQNVQEVKGMSMLTEQLCRVEILPQEAVKASRSMESCRRQLEAQKGCLRRRNWWNMLWERGKRVRCPNEHVVSR